MPVGIERDPIERVSPARVFGKRKGSRATSFIDARFDTVEEAAAHAGAIFNGASVAEDFEVGGGILKDNDGKFYFTFSLGERETGAVSFNIVRPAGHKTVATWHTHGNESDTREFFSETDMKTAKDLGVPFYMVDFTGTLRVLNGEDAKPETIRRPMLDKVGREAVGETVIVPGKPVLDKDGEQIMVRNELGAALFPEREQQAQKNELPPPQKAARPQRIRADAPVRSNDPRRDTSSR